MRRRSLGAVVLGRVTSKPELTEDGTTRSLCDQSEPSAGASAKIQRKSQ